MSRNMKTSTQIETKLLELEKTQKDLESTIGDPLREVPGTKDAIMVLAARRHALLWVLGQRSMDGTE